MKVTETGTFARHMGGGFLRTIDGGAIQCMVMPSQPSVRDAADWGEREKAAAPMFAIMQGLADLVPKGVGRNRRLLRTFYRRIRFLAVSASRPFEPSPTLDGANRARLAREQADTVVHDRFTLVCVRLQSGVGAKGLESLRESMADASGYVADAAFDADRRRIRLILESAGCVEPDGMLMQRALAWWPTERRADRLPVMVEPEHVHVFPSYRMCRLAAKYKRTRIDCADWSKRIGRSYAMTLATLGVTPFRGQDERRSPDSAWAARLLASREGGGGGAIALSVTGLVEPGELSREQIDKDKDKVLDKAYEQATGGHTDNMRVAGELDEASRLYNMEGKPWPTLIEANVTAAMPGVLDNAGMVPYPGQVTLNPDRQQYAFEQMMVGSNVEYNPSPVFWPTPMLAYAGLNGRSFTGDDTGRGLASDLPGALVGVSEADRQPVYDSPLSASMRHGKAITTIVGSTGSGKAISLSTSLPVPPQPRLPQGGLVPLRDLKTGDLLYSRDGKTYPITGMSPIRTHDMFEMTLSDGQRIRCSGAHQWVAWTWRDRNAPRCAKHRASLDRRALYARVHDALYEAAGRAPDEWWSLVAILRQTSPIIAPLGLRNPADSFKEAMRFTDTPMRRMRGLGMSRKGRRYPPVPLLEWLYDEWDRNAGRMPLAKRADRLDRIRRALDRNPVEPVNVPDLAHLLGLKPANVASAFARYPGEPVAAPRLAWRENVACWHAPDALRAWADRLMWRYHDDPGARHGEQVVTTRIMLDEGLTTTEGQANWAILKPEPLEGKPLDLPLDPWCLGAWLADGARRAGEIASDPSNGDLDHARRRFEQAGFKTTGRAAACMFGVPGLVPILRRLGVYGDKHIPEVYQHASLEQRLELVRGLLDHDGFIDAHGSIEFTQSVDHKPIVDALTRLLRSLGIVVHEATRSKAGYRDGNGVRHTTQDRLRLTFTTDMPVFSLPRKRALLPKTLRETQRWLYVKDIQPIADEPHRCLSIASPDHTYLVAGYVPTHNTRLGLHLAAQFGRLPSPVEPGRTLPVVFWNPKSNSSDFLPFVTRMGGREYRLDAADAAGILDPLRCIPAPMRSMIVQTSTAMLSQILSGRAGSRTHEIAITSIVGYGLRHGARSLGEAVDMAWRAHRDGSDDGQVSDDVEHIKPDLDRLLLNDPLMPLVYGTGDKGGRLAVSQGFTLLSAGSLNVIGDKDVDTATSAVQRWVCRMAMVGASGLLVGRYGVLVMDEAWSVLMDDYGRSLVNRMGRLMRDQRYSMLMLSQKAGEFVDAHMEDFIGKTYSLAVGGRNEGSGRESEAQAACRLANQPLDGRMHARMMRDRVVDPDSRAPDPESLYALTDASSGALLRGSIAYMQVGDQASAIPVEVRVDPKLA